MTELQDLLQWGSGSGFSAVALVSFQCRSWVFLEFAKNLWRVCVLTIVESWHGMAVATVRFGG